MQVELYGVLREAAGDDRVELALAAPARVEDVLAALTEAVPALAPHLPRVACAVGDEMVAREDRVAGDRPLVLLPPVSGG